MEAGKTQHDTAIGILPGKWSARAAATNREIDVNPARVSCFHQNGAESGRINRDLRLLIINLHQVCDGHVFCILGFRQELPEIQIMHQPCFPRRQSGFTLIEIAIVLVIIGLLLGGILKGQELINSARVKNLATDFRNIPVFIYGYQDKFKALPGDDPAVVAHVGGTLATTGSTPGDGIIDGAWDSDTVTHESFLFWQHVRLAGLAPGATNTGGTDYEPLNAVGGRVGIQSAKPFSTMNSGTWFICSAGITGKFAKQLDTQLDDGVTNTGSMQAGTVNTATPGAATASLDDAVQYTVCMGV